jgi:hypothetical protein
LILTLPHGGICKKGGNNTVTVELLCNMDENTLKMTNEDQFDPESCSNVLKFTTKRACRVTKFSPWYKDLGLPKSVVGLILGLIGLFFVFLGSKYFAITSAAIIAICSGLIIKSFLDPFMKIELYVCVILGILLAYFIYSMVSLVNLVLAVIIGYFVGNMVYNYMVKIFTGINPNTLYIIVLIVCILLVVYLAYLIAEIIVIVATSLIGAYCAIRGLSINLGGFPDETYTSKLILYKEFNQLGRAFSGANMYLLGMLVLFIVGLVVQGGIAFFTKSENQTNQTEKPVENADPSEAKKLLSEDTGKTTTAGENA